MVVAQGPITFGEQPPGTIGGESTSALLRKAREDEAIKAVVLRVDSPGGGVFPSEQIRREVVALREAGKPVVVSMANVAASGGYYVAMTGDPVVAYPGTITGSIGVIYGKANLRGLYGKIGVNKEILKRGRHADLDSDFQKLTPETRAKLRETIDFIYAGFLKRVSEGRKKKVEEIEPFAQGRVWSGQRARQHGLIDATGGIDAAVALLRQKAGVKEDEVVRLSVFPAPKSLFDVLFRPSPSDEAGIDAETALLRRSLPAGLAPWIEGGFLRVLPFQIRIE